MEFLGLSAVNWATVAGILVIILIFVSNWLLDAGTANENMASVVDELRSELIHTKDMLRISNRQVNTLNSELLSKPAASRKTPKRVKSTSGDSRRNVYQQTNHGNNNSIAAVALASDSSSSSSSCSSSTSSYSGSCSGSSSSSFDSGGM